MAWWQLSVQSSAAELEQTEASLLALGAVSITLSDAKDEPIYEPLPGDTPVWQHSLVTGLFEQEQTLEFLHNGLLAQLQPDQIPSLRKTVVEDQDWERAHLQHFEPIHCGNNLWVVPSWFEVPDPEAINIQLDPGLAFGTGSHPTTALCLAWLSSKNLKNQSVIDYGCGSGILAIAACKLGATRLNAVDIDQQALDATRDNMRRNGIDPEAHNISPPGQIGAGTCDLLMANILCQPLIELAQTFSQLVKKDGRILLSGILSTQLNEIKLAYQWYFDLEQPCIEEQWVSISGKRKT